MKDRIGDHSDDPKTLVAELGNRPAEVVTEAGKEESETTSELLLKPEEPQMSFAGTASRFKKYKTKKRRLINGGRSLPNGPTAAEIVRGTGPSEYLNLEDVAKFLKVPVSWVYERVRENLIPHSRSGRKYRFKRDEIVSWVDEFNRTLGKYSVVSRWKGRVKKPDAEKK